MKQLKTFEEYNALYRDFLRRGVCTNEFPDITACRQEIAEGVLFSEETDGAVLLFRDRGSHLRMNFFLQTMQMPPLPAGKPIVTELAFRERDTKLAETVDFLRERGFTLLAKRGRLTRLRGIVPPETSPAVRPAELSELERADARLRACFDPLTGCLPPRWELEQSIRSGEVLLSEHGILHFSKGRTAAELRHLAVEAPFRGRGEAQALLSAFLRETAEQRTYVWVRQGNRPAEALYRKNFFVPDGWTSAVLIRREDD